MTNHGIKTINIHELKKRMEENPDLCLIDVRELNEWQAVRIADAIHIPKDKITEQIQTHLPDKHHSVYLHCKAGVRSLYAAQCLRDLGYQQVYSVDGGIMEWAALGYPVLVAQ